MKQWHRLPFTLFGLMWASDALAYRPFDGTDAAVADPRQVERVVAEVPLPLNLIAFPGAPPKQDWAAAGVAMNRNAPATSADAPAR